MHSDFDGQADWILDLGASAGASKDADSKPTLASLAEAAEHLQAHPLDAHAADSLRRAVRAATEAGVDESLIAVTGRISVDTVRRIIRPDERA
jgi:hypothetical protein